LRQWLDFAAHQHFFNNFCCFLFDHSFFIRVYSFKIPQKIMSSIPLHSLPKQQALIRWVSYAGSIKFFLLWLFIITIIIIFPPYPITCKTIFFNVIAKFQKKQVTHFSWNLFSTFNQFYYLSNSTYFNQPQHFFKCRKYVQCFQFFILLYLFSPKINKNNCTSLFIKFQHNY
jgi:hypothetical protein